MPPRAVRRAPPDKALDMCGTTLRVWDAQLQAWRITWINPVTGQRDDQIGRRVGNDIVQAGTRPDGTPTRWMFTELTRDSFRWTGEALEGDGRTWRLGGEFRHDARAESAARRAPALALGVPQPHAGAAGRSRRARPAGWAGTLQALLELVDEARIGRRTQLCSLPTSVSSLGSCTRLKIHGVSR